MQNFLITGGKPLKGVVMVKGAKNSSTKLMIASLLTEDKVTLHNIPEILDTALTEELLREVGSSISHAGKAAVVLRSRNLKKHVVKELSCKNRIPVLALAPLLHRKGKAEVPFVGGDAIGHRPIGFHLAILKKMGAVVRQKKHSYEAHIRQRLNGAVVVLPYPSVGATETAILAGVLARGKTVIKNAAGEPEIIDLISLLQKMGAIIELGTNRVISIEGVKRLNGAEHTVLPDRNEAVSFAVLALATCGNIVVRGARQDHLITFLNSVRRIGGEYTVEDGGIRFYRNDDRPFLPLMVETSPHPGFMTDWQQPFTILLTMARGVSFVHETVYEDRFGYIKDLRRMGAKIRIMTKCVGAKCRFAKRRYGHSIEVRGAARLRGANIEICDIRAGIAHLIAALSAEGKSEISGIEHIDRGYENIDERLRSVGANINRT